MERIEALKVRTGVIKARLLHGFKELVQQVDFTISEGESLALIGETGSGKTMTALSIMGLLPENVRQEGGEISFFGEIWKGSRDISRHLGRDIVYIPQNGLEFLNPSRTIRKQFLDGLSRNHVPLREREEKMRELLRKAGLSDEKRILSAYPFELSGGMAQKVTIAMAGCGKVRLILADEPTNGLDREATERFFRLMEEMFPHAARLIITHDISVAELCDRIVVLCGGKICERGPAKEVLTNPMHPYTRALWEALPENGMKESPVLRKQEGPCAYYKRCPNAEDSCREKIRFVQSTGREWWCNRP